MHKKIWTISVYIFTTSTVALTAVAIAAIWGVIPKEVVWKSFSSAGALALLLIALSAALKAIDRSPSAPTMPSKTDDSSTPQ